MRTFLSVLTVLLVCVSKTRADPPPGFLMGDANCDGIVDITDLGIVATNWQTYDADWIGNYDGWPYGDFNQDGYVDISDLGIVATNWQTDQRAFADEFDDTEVNWNEWEDHFWDEDPFDGASYMIFDDVLWMSVPDAETPAGLCTYNAPNAFSFLYGYAEARMKVPSGQGVWPAFWALPVKDGNGDAGYPLDSTCYNL